MMYAYLGIGFLLFALGSEAIRRGGSGLFAVSGTPPIFIGLLFAAFAASAPALSVALQASARGATDIALGDIVGGVIANTLLVFGLGAMLRSRPTPPKVVFRDGGVMALASIAVAGIVAVGAEDRVLAAGLLAGWLAYLVLVVLTDWRRPSAFGSSGAGRSAGGKDKSAAANLFLLAVGVLCLAFGGRFAVDCAAAIAAHDRLPQVFVALTLIAFGTSLPELVTVLTRGPRGPAGFGSSELIATNIFTLLMVLGAMAAFGHVPAPPLVTQRAGPVMAGSALLLVALLIPGWRLTRLQGVLLFLLYLSYLALLIARSGVHLA